LGVATLAVVATSAPAASPDPKAMRKALADYGKCIVKREPAKSREFVLGGGFITRRDNDENILLSPECMPGEELVRAGLAARGGTVSRARLRLPDVMIRWSIGQALFDRDQAKLTATDFSGVPALAYEQPFPVRTTDRDGKPIPADRVAQQQRRYDEKAGDVALSRVGECVVRADAAKARAVLLTPLDTPEELSALQAVAPALSNCLPQGQTLGFDRMSLRGTLAVAYYRLASAVQQNGAAS
ncbi:MAG TPA: hypothetical protein PLL48_17505, partial [Novosphingobium sp.]|nr:hypothetical protein [Novosphingobium sp.]